MPNEEPEDTFEKFEVLDITLSKTKERVQRPHPKASRPVRDVWIAEASPFPSCTGRSARDALDALATMAEQRVEGNSEYDREDDHE